MNAPPQALELLDIPLAPKRRISVLMYEDNAIEIEFGAGRELLTDDTLKRLAQTLSTICQMKGIPL